MTNDLFFPNSWNIRMLIYHVKKLPIKEIKNSYLRSIFEKEKLLKILKKIFKNALCFSKVEKLIKKEREWFPARIKLTKSGEAERVCFSSKAERFFNKFSSFGKKPWKPARPEWLFSQSFTYFWTHFLTISKIKTYFLNIKYCQKRAY